MVWTPKPPLNGAPVFLSASVPHPERDKRFLAGPLDDWLMLRVIDQRIYDAVQSLVAQVLMAGGRVGYVCWCVAERSCTLMQGVACLCRCIILSLNVVCSTLERLLSVYVNVC